MSTEFGRLSLQNVCAFSQNGNSTRFLEPDQDMWNSERFMFLWIYTFRDCFVEVNE